MSQDERMFSIDLQSIDLTGFIQRGKVLDIGGGGEGIIGQLLGDQVVAIDPRADELLEAAEGPLKIVMDARDLKFLNNTFDGGTSFFTLMYIKKEDHQKVLEEMYRVLKEEGQFIIWDAKIPM
ncbi:class I SAM-dependent methyltransferase [Alkaliphilus serpentinus]|uniref:Class I SAM-dependent methyltransferase n=1 Tax=Alkaliphilus serpentinus TaxID=1482731 RepID=A0A833HQB2_9FIRM|nr:class I SAM-dependent methyltransferase [Alkaliphilus serpentinus]KAB3531590.1 class I SAM-dependent methyltransferase [Alkaliphilus serpentinus]